MHNNAKLKVQPPCYTQFILVSMPGRWSKAWPGVFLDPKENHSLEVNKCKSGYEVFYLKLSVIMIRVLILMRGLLIKIQAFMFSLNKGNESKAPWPLCRLSWLQRIYKWNIFGTTKSKEWVYFPWFMLASPQTLVRIMLVFLSTVPLANTGNSGVAKLKRFVLLRQFLLWNRNYSTALLAFVSAVWLIA